MSGENLEISSPGDGGECDATFGNRGAGRQSMSEGKLIGLFQTCCEGGSGASGDGRRCLAELLAAGEQS